MLDQIIALIKAGNGIAIAIFVLTLVQTWMQPSSKFPITIPERFQPVFAAFTGQLYAVLLVVAAHQSWAMAVVHGIGVTVVVLFTSHAIWETGNAPAWAKFLAMIIPELIPDAHSAATPNPPAPPKTPSKRPTPMPPAPLAMLTFVLAFFVGCSIFSSKPQTIPDSTAAGICILDHALAGETIEQIQKNCGDLERTVVVDFLTAHEKLAAHEKQLGAPCPACGAAPAPAVSAPAPAVPVDGGK